jgi:hypothetical protein
MNPTNTTCPINIPELWHNGDCSLLCRPAKWYDILIFFSGNYLAHAATVTSTPGAAPLSRALNMLKALLFPISGFILGLEAIASMAMAAKTPLQTAARAGALLMVVKTGKRRQAIRAIGNVQRNPIGGGGAVELSDLEQGHSLSNSAPQVHRYRPWCNVKIHGYDHLPEGYEFRRVYRHAIFKNDEKEAPEQDSNRCCLQLKWSQGYCVYRAACLRYRHIIQDKRRPGRAIRLRSLWAYCDAIRSDERLQSCGQSAATRLPIDVHRQVAGIGRITK